MVYINGQKPLHIVLIFNTQVCSLYFRKIHILLARKCPARNKNDFSSVDVPSYKRELGLDSYALRHHRNLKKYMTEPVLNQYLHVHFLGRIVRQIRMA
jgi:hypothetical protein